MKFHHLQKVFITFFFLKIVKINSNDIKILKIENCTASGKSAEISKCEIFDNKIYIEGSALVDVNHVFVHVALFMKYDRNWKSLFSSRPINWCKMFDGSNPKLSPFQKGLFNALSKNLKSIIRRCPFPAAFYKVVVASVERKFVLMLPEGIYRFDIEVFNKNDSMILAFSVTFELEK